MLPIYVINLDSQPERWQTCLSRLDGLGLECERVPALTGVENVFVNGAQVRYDALRTDCGPDLILPEIGCYLSHIHVWQIIVDAGHTAAFVFEDDFIPQDNFVRALESMSIAGFRQPTMVRLEDRQETPKAVYQEPLPDKEHILTTPVHIPVGSAAYWINRAACGRFLKTRQVFSRPVDEDFRWFWETRVDVKELLPYPASHPDYSAGGQPGTISNIREVTGGADGTGWVESQSAYYWQRRRRLNRVHTPERWLRRNLLVRSPQ